MMLEREQSGKVLSEWNAIMDLDLPSSRSTMLPTFGGAGRGSASLAGFGSSSSGHNVFALPTPSPSTVNSFLKDVNLTDASLSSLMTTIGGGFSSSEHSHLGKLSTGSSASATGKPILDVGSNTGYGNLLPVTGMEVPSPFDDIFVKSADPFGTSTMSANAFGSGPTSRAAAATANGGGVGQLIVPEQNSISPIEAAAAAALASSRQLAKPTRPQFNVDFASVGVPVGYTSASPPTSRSPSPSPLEAGPPARAAGYGVANSNAGGPLRSRPRRPTARAAALSAGRSSESPTGHNSSGTYIPSASNPADVAAALAELDELGIDADASSDKDYVIALVKRHDVKMMTQLAWKLFFKPEIKALLSAAEVEKVKKDRRRAKGTIYAQNSRRKQAVEKTHTSGRIGELEQENMDLKAQVRALTAQLRAARSSAR